MQGWTNDFRHSPCHLVALAISTAGSSAFEASQAATSEVAVWVHVVFSAFAMAWASAAAASVVAEV